MKPDSYVLYLRNEIRQSRRKRIRAEIANRRRPNKASQRVVDQSEARNKALGDALITYLKTRIKLPDCKS